MFRFNEDEEDLVSDAPGSMPSAPAPVLKAQPSELELLQKEQADAEKKKAYLKIAGGIFQNMSDAPMASEIYYKRNSPKANVKGMFDAAADTVGDPMDKSRKAQEYLKMKREGRLGAEQDDALAREKSLDSNETKALKALAPRWGIQVTPEMTAYDIKQLIDPKKMMETEASSRVNYENQVELEKLRQRGDLKKFGMQKRIDAEAKEAAKAEKLALDEKGRTTTFGVARTEDDAKKLKEASEVKADMDAGISELIALRKRYGAEAWNRDAVARGQQISKNLLLQKKKLESLGVLSKSDLDIVNEIIPSDPLQYNVAQMVGQDPTMTKLEAFKADTDRDFQSRLKGRLENYQEPDAEVEQYAKKHGISYEAALKVKEQRTSNIGKR